MPPRTRRNSSGRAPTNRRDTRHRMTTDSEPKYGWQNIYGFDNQDGTISGTVLLTEDFLTALALRLLNQDYEGRDEDNELEFDDQGRITLRFKLRPGTGKTHWMGNIYETQNDKNYSRGRYNDSRYQNDRESNPRTQSRPGSAKPRQTSRPRSRPLYENADEDDYDDRPF